MSKSGIASRQFTLPLAALASTVCTLGYSPRSVYAGSCGATGPSTYLCENAANSMLDVTQSLSASSITFSSNFGFTPAAGILDIEVASDAGLVITDNRPASGGASNAIVSSIHVDNEYDGELNLSFTGKLGDASQIDSALRVNYSPSVTHSTDAGDITINLGDVEVVDGEEAIRFINPGRGNATITSTGTITGDMFVRDNSYSGFTRVQLNDLNANEATTLRSYHNGRGPLDITINGDVTVTRSSGGTERAVNVYSRGNTTTAPATLNIGNVTTTNADALRVYSAGPANAGNTMTITQTGTFTTNQSGHGLNIYYLSAVARDVIATIDTIISAENGIHTAYGYSPVASINITLNGSITADGTGIHVPHSGTATNITLDGNVTGGSGAGITTGGAGQATVNINDNVNISATSGTAFSTVGVGGIDESNTVLNILDTATVTGNIMLDAGDDSIVFNGIGDITTLGNFDGGADSDSIRFNNVTGEFTGAQFMNWEHVILGTSTQLAFTDNAITADILETVDGATLDASGGLALTGSMNNFGTISLGDGNPGDTMDVSLDYAAQSDLILDVVLDDGAGGGTADVLNIAGTVSGDTTVRVNNVGGLGAQTIGDGILLITTGSSSDDSFHLAGGSVRGGEYLYFLVRVDNNWYLQSTFRPLNIPSLSSWALSLLAGFMGGLGALGLGRRRVSVRG